jgi:hypothetical protein
VLVASLLVAPVLVASLLVAPVLVASLLVMASSLPRQFRYRSVLSDRRYRGDGT